MAHAALLNLRGAEAHAQHSTQPDQQSQNKDGALGQNISPLHTHNMGIRMTPAMATDPLINTYARSSLGVPREMVSPAQGLTVGNALPSLVRSNSLSTLDISGFHPSSTTVGNALTLQSGLSPVARASFGIDTQPSLSAKALEASRLALLQQEARLKQLQLLQQMQALQDHDTRGLNAILGSHSHTLMPSAKIAPTRNGGQFGGEAGLPSAQHYSQASDIKACPPLSPRGGDFQLEEKTAGMISQAQSRRDRQQSSSVRFNL